MDVYFLKGLGKALDASKVAPQNTSTRKQKLKLRNKRKRVAVGGVNQPQRKSHEIDFLTSQIHASMFRFLNEKLYTSPSGDAVKFFEEDPSAFQIYHKGFQNQLRKWPYDPLNWPEQIIRTEFKDNAVIADMGCGDARLALHLDKVATVHSFDLVAVNERVTVCDMAHTPLPRSSVDIVVFCLALMGTNCRDFIYEANRVLKMDGTLLIVEVASRFDMPFKKFLRLLKPFGFKAIHWEITKDTYFVHGRLCKVEEISNLSFFTLPDITINPCLYKKR